MPCDVKLLEMNSLTSVFSIHLKIECPCIYGGTKDEVRRREKRREGREGGKKENTERQKRKMTNVLLH